MKCIQYEDGYRYQLKQDYRLDVPVRPETNQTHEFVHLTRDGDLLIRAGYAWDGPSGPVIHARSFMRASLVHDALYQLMRQGEPGGLSEAQHRAGADTLLREHCIADGMSVLLAWCVYWAVRLGGGPWSRPAAGKPLLHAPEGCPVRG